MSEGTSDVRIFNKTTEEWIDVFQSGEDPYVYIGSFSFPANETEEDQIYELECYYKDEATGLTQTITVFAEEGELVVDSFEVDVNELSHMGGEVNFTITLKLDNSEDNE